MKKTIIGIILTILTFSLFAQNYGNHNAGRFTTLEGYMQANGTSNITATFDSIAVDTLIAHNELYVRDTSLIDLIELYGGGVAINNDADNRVITALGNGELNAESNLTYNGSQLSVGTTNMTNGQIVTTGSSLTVGKFATPGGYITFNNTDSDFTFTNVKTSVGGNVFVGSEGGRDGVYISGISTPTTTETLGNAMFRFKSRNSSGSRPGGVLFRTETDYNTNVYTNPFSVSSGMVSVYSRLGFKPTYQSGSNFVEMYSSGTDFNIESPVTTTDFNYLDGINLNVYDATNTDYIQISHDGTDANFDFSGTTGLNINDVEDVSIGIGKTGGILVEIEDESISDGEIRAFIANATHNSNTRTSGIGVRTHAGITNAVSYIFLQEEDGGASFYWTDNSGNLRISSNATHLGTTSGVVVGTQTSDIRLKNVTSFNYGLSEIMQINPIGFTYTYDSENTPRIGFSAQELQSIVPESVYDTGEDVDGSDSTKLAMDYSALIPVLVKSIQELEQRISELENK